MTHKKPVHEAGLERDSGDGGDICWRRASNTSKMSQGDGGNRTERRSANHTPH